VADVGLRAGVIPPAVFAMLVVMAVATTAMTAPLLHWIYPLRYLQALGSSVRTGDSSGERRRGFTVMIPVSLPKSGAPLVQLAESLIGEERDRSRLLAIHLRRPVDHDAYRSGLDEAAQSHDESLAPLLAQARGRMIPVEQISFISLDVAGDISTVARLNDVDLVLMGFHKPVIGRTILGGTVHRVLHQCERDVAVFVDRGFRAARRVLVPYLGSPHDRLALELAHRIARHTEAQVTVLHIVAPMRYGDGGAAGVRSAVDRIFEEPGRKTPVTFRVIEDESPVGVVLHQSQNADLVIIGVGEEWGLESHLFGWRAQRIARDCPSSLLLVRKAGGRGGAEADEIAGEAAAGSGDPVQPS
jgi:nucleotide-binding universal stress UspA family protein